MGTKLEIFHGGHGMISISLAPVCGIYCGECQFLGKTCEGCGKIKGRPFWTAEMPTKICPLFDCCVNQRKLEHCGLCDEFPCKTFLTLRDPSLSDEEFRKSVTARHDALRERAKLGTEKWLEERAKGVQKK
jgi:hypothetical protein